MTAAAEILVLGSVNRDLIVHAPRLPLPGETLRGQRFGSCLGGKGANQAVAAARLGAKVALAARVGLLENGRTTMFCGKAISLLRVGLQGKWRRKYGALSTISRRRL